MYASPHTGQWIPARLNAVTLTAHHESAQSQEQDHDQGKTRHQGSEEGSSLVEKGEEGSKNSEEANERRYSSANCPLSVKFGW